MTWFVKCDTCGALVPAPANRMGDPYNPTNWWSRVNEQGKSIHACSRECRNKQGGTTIPF